MEPIEGEGEGSKEAESPKKEKRHGLLGLFRAKGRSVKDGNVEGDTIGY